MRYVLSYANCTYGDPIVAHFALHPQREYLDTTDLLSRYQNLTSVGRSFSKTIFTPALETGKLWAARLLETVDRFARCSREELESEDFVAKQLRLAGLIRDRRLLYGDNNRYMNTESEGLWQIPMQMARFYAPSSIPN